MGRRIRRNMSQHGGIAVNLFFADIAQAVSKLWYYNRSLVSTILIFFIIIIIIIIPYIMIALVSASQSPKINFECEVPVQALNISAQLADILSAQGSYPTCDISPNPSAICHGILYRPSLDYHSLKILPLLLRGWSVQGSGLATVILSNYLFAFPHANKTWNKIEILQIISHPIPWCPSKWCKWSVSPKQTKLVIKEPCSQTKLVIPQSK